MRIVIYGNGDKNEKTGFPSEAHFVDYVRGGIFTTFKGRYQYSQRRNADIILLSRQGKVYGYFKISGTQDPNAHDSAIAKNPKKAYLVSESIFFQNPVTVNDIGIKGYQFGKSVSLEQFDEIERLGGTQTSFLPSLS